jgi:hypothetical protein
MFFGIHILRSWFSKFFLILPFLIGYNPKYTFPKVPLRLNFGFESYVSRFWTYSSDLPS